ncbi:hypothetical protein KB206_05270 [Microvirga sp. STS02]|uniref:hypothetical protein n=1 Tax=Hymenobacter negativus TaxID=2795026 RepID=UPI0018DBD404|nr:MULTISPECIES: hypothetical protein [Bacteria]MBH8568282.1 hypothetical protein [Hymenobacter negativus]MBR7208017.1 hypothetical protein [Microvirga sp. STS02]
MLFATRPRLFHSRLLALLVVAGGLASGCQSSRPSFSFQPMPGRVREVKPAAATAATQESAPVPAATSTAQQDVQAATSPLIARKQSHALRHSAPVLASTQTAVASPLPVMRRTALHRRPLLARPRATAEAGLGTTVLGVLGLVVLPIAAVGLILSGGGLGWIIVGGLAALAVVVAYLDPFGR